AMYANLKAGRIVQGGSTITQQVAKSLLLNRRRSIARKIKDFLLAQRIEEKFTKKEILFLYLNQVYLGGGYYGIKAAFRGYYGKELTETTIAESAMLAGLLVAPGKYSPYINPKRAKNRQGYVLKRMRDTGKISEEEYANAINEKIKFKVKKKNNFKAGHFTDWIRQRMIELVGEEEFLTGGFHIQTTLNWKLQQMAEKEILKGAKEIDKRQGFKGPLGNIDTDEEITQYEVDFRKRTYRNASDYFTVTDDYEKKYQVNYKESYFNDLKEYRKNHILTRRVSKTPPGNRKNDPLIPYIKKGKIIEAVVTKINSRARMIFVSIGGLTGIIPFDNFKWAKERVIEDKIQYHPPMSNPAKILEKGDIILVKIENTSVRIIKHLFGNYTASLKQAKLYRPISKERYILCLLDQKPEVQAALMAISPRNFEIISMVGGTDFSQSQFNRAIQSKRQPGSSFKPILYAAALENGLTPSSIIIDSPEALGGVDEFLNWKPSNYDGKFAGPTTFRNALEQSRNIPTIKIANKIGVDTVIDFAERI
ncbi:MAG: transglycosylase domain-containing protein, partial [Halobacteriovoraceae bacterium]|nr:transglycosylase domain-containing protein [Halobacteriovoraceae bacterium]